MYDFPMRKDSSALCAHCDILGHFRRSTKKNNMGDRVPQEKKIGEFEESEPQITWWVTRPMTQGWEGRSLLSAGS